MKFILPKRCVRGLLAALLFTNAVMAQEPTSALDRANALIPAELFDKTAKISPGGTRHLIIVVGENHASVRTQTELATMLEALNRAKLMDAILIEGSNGAVSVSALRKQVATDKAAPFWRGRLELGQIAGYEYVALTQPGVVVYGVEDMKAKRDYAVGAARRAVGESLNRLIAMHERAYEIAKRSLEQAGNGSTAAGTGRTDIAEYRRRIDALAKFKDSDAARYAELEATYTALAEDATLLYTKLRPVFPIATELGRAFRDGAQADQAKLSELWARFEAAAKKAGYRDGEQALGDLKRFNEIEDQFDPSKSALSRNREASSTKLESLYESVDDQFFVVANSVRVALGKPVPQLQSLLSDERSRAREESVDPEVPYLAQRDERMVANTLQYLREHPKASSIVLVIGYAHLDSIAKRLGESGVAVLAGRLASSRDEIEAWENRAWQHRHFPPARVFSRDAMKELARLGDQTFKEESLAAIRTLEKLQSPGAPAIPSGAGRVFEVKTAGAGTKAVAVGNWAGVEKFNWGSQVVDYGYLPGATTGEKYLVFDRAAARAEAQRLSTDDYLFVPSYRTRTEQGLKMQFESQSGSTDLVGFRAAPPKTRDGKIPERVVLVSEPDGGATYRSLQTSGSGGGGKPPWTTTFAGFAEAPEPGKRLPGIFQTINAKRAKAKLDALAKQEPLRWGDVASIKLGFGPGEPSMMDQLWFTPGRGDRARVYLIVGENSEHFQSELKNAADAGLFRNKQVVLATCFENERTPRLREMLLEAGALIVWTPERKITPEAAEKLGKYLKLAAEQGDGAAQPRTMDAAITDALKLWHEEEKGDASLRSVIDGSKWVDLIPRAFESPRGLLSRNSGEKVSQG